MENWPIENKTDKKETSFSPKNLTIFSVLLFLLSVVSVICCPLSLGINIWIDAIAQLTPVCGVTAFLVWLFVCSQFVYCLFKRRFVRAIQFFAVSLLLFFTVGLIMPATGRISPSYLREECAENMQKIGEELRQYAKNHNDNLPAEEWCDVLVMDYKQDTFHLCCRGCLGDLEKGSRLMHLILTLSQQNFLTCLRT